MCRFEHYLTLGNPIPDSLLDTIRYTNVISSTDALRILSMNDDECYFWEKGAQISTRNEVSLINFL